MGGFILAVAILYPEYVREKMRAIMLEKMNERHNDRILRCETGSFRIVIKACAKQ